MLQIKAINRLIKLIVPQRYLVIKSLLLALFIYCELSAMSAILLNILIFNQ